MIKVLIAEDERIERDALLDLMREKFGEKISQLTVTNNGKQALDAFTKDDYQIVITDINMPKMSGLELMTEIRQKDKNTHFVVLTSYDYFEYAQEAIRIGVDDYILKPTNSDELCNKISKIINLIENKTEINKSYDQEHMKEVRFLLNSDLVYSIIKNESVELIRKLFNILHIEYRNMFCVCLNRNQISLDKVQHFVDNIALKFSNCLYETYFSHIVVFVFNDNDIEDGEKEEVLLIARELLGEESLVGISKTEYEIQSFYKTFVQAREDLETKSLFGDSLMQENKSLDYQLVQIVKEMVYKIKIGKKESAIWIIEQVYKMRQKNEVYSYQIILEKLYSILLNVLKEDEQLKECFDSFKEYDTYITKVEDEASMSDFFVELYRNIINPFINGRMNKRNNMVKEIYVFIEKNYQSPIGLDELANYMKLTPQYISSVLSKNGQDSFTNILAKYRIEKAKELFKENISIKEVASRVGFQNQNYFSKTFKKITGLTPKEYKELF